MFTLAVVYVVLLHSCHLQNANEEGANIIGSEINILHDLITGQVTHLKKCVCLS